MTFAATHQPRTVVVTDIVGGIPVVTAIDGWNITDDGSPVAFVGAHESHRASAEVYAQRIAELLNRHGMADVPDQPEEPHE